jgi:hypothetical protein
MMAYSDDGSSRFVRNVGTYLQDYKAPCHLVFVNVYYSFNLMFSLSNEKQFELHAQFLF